MGNPRVQRVEETLRRAIAEVILFGNLRDPRLRQTASIGITAVRVSADLSIARVYIDPVTAGVDIDVLLAGLRAAAPVIRREVGQRVQLRRVPELRFIPDESVEKGLAIERALLELREEDARAEPQAEPDDGERS
ncbi:MAG: 30S ribosome-binding factor RbfA [Myxococcales bacterium]|nr:30S ribosome-binding factor RbfA [Myxococcales bacterium]